MSDNCYLNQAAARALVYRNRVDRDTPYPRLDAKGLRALFDTGLPEIGRPGSEVLTQLADAAEAGLVASTGDSFYSWVMGASDPVGIAADWLTSAWGQNSAIYQTAPSAAIAEEVAGKWLVDLLGLPARSTVAFTTGGTMASFICLAAARTHVLQKAGWDIEAQGQFGAPEIAIYVGREAHSAIFCALRYLGFGHQRLIVIDADNEGRMKTDDLAGKISEGRGPSIIIAQAGHINTGAFDDFGAISALAKATGSWLHIDGAFGLWAKASPKHSHHCASAEYADSWAVDGHKWLQVPYDSGFGIVKHEDAHCRAMATTAGYLNEMPEDGRNPTYYVPEISRRARGFTVWAVLQSMGRCGIADIVEGNCNNAARLATHLNGVPGVRILHKVELNQISLVFEDAADPATNMTRQVIHALQRDRRWFVKEADWRGETIMRLSFSSGTKTDAQIDEFADAIRDAWSAISDPNCRSQVIERMGGNGQ
ncbi:MAG: pyridoxal phosphate-dependent decarboxylase family protein [Paracoccaceae bacterium]